MRQLFVAVAAIAGLGLLTGLTQAGKVEVKGAHLCCNQCVKIVGATLAKVDGVSEAKCDRDTRTVTFTAKDSKAATAGVKALFDAGFFGTATEDGKPIKLEEATPRKGERANEVTVKAVHVCCKQCQNAIDALFKDGKVSYEGKGPQRDVKVSGTGLDKAEVLETLRKAGFNGKVD
ncbi:MAG TPA: heavy metal-associated domain-containing protein [Gemmataceae bacterium]|nr:heavy metal-associated domain-containing protein [Gemmataceae bacterium]